MRVKQIIGTDLAQLSNCKGLSALLSPKWIDLQPIGMVYFAVESERGVEAYFSAYSYKKYGKQFLITPPNFPYCGFQMVQEYDGEFDKKSRMSLVLEALAKFLDTTYPKGYFDFAFPPEVTDMQNFELMKFEIDQKHTYLIDLSQDREVLFKSLSSNRRRNVKSVSKGYEVKWNVREAEGLKLVDHTLQKSKNTKMRPLYENMLLNHKVSWIDCITVSKKQQPVSAVVTVSDRDELFYFAGGFDPEVGDNNAGTIALWNAIERAQENGMTTFNFCGSSIPTIEKYFKSFGPTFTPYFRLRRGGRLVNNLKSVLSKIKS